MKKKNLIVALSVATCAPVCAQKAVTDSSRVVNLQEAVVASTRATAKTPVAFTNVSKKEIESQNFGLDLPFLLLRTPSVLTTSDAGAGVGYTTIRVRGTDATRINITANGIPMNDAESHQIFWVNTPDLASSLQDIQVQRGAGTSTNGSGAFGASVNLRTGNISMKPFARVSGSYGSFNTHRETVQAGTGLLGGHWAFDARLSNIQSDGYRDRASSDLKSYFIQGGYFADRTTVKLITFSGKEKTYHAWDGISREQLESDRTYNPNGEYVGDDGKIHYYGDQNDNYRQTHYQLLLTQLLSRGWTFNAALHYTNGYGFYQEYKTNRTLEEYGLVPFPVAGSTELQTKSDLIRKKIVDSDFGGGLFSFDYKAGRWDASLGGSLNYYNNHHTGRLLWVKNYVGALLPDQKYYDNESSKTDGTVYGKATYEIARGLSAYADLQYRYIRYKITGVNDAWDWTATPAHMQQLHINEPFSFFNPKAGLFWKINPQHSAYASFSVAQKEPTRNNYTDGLLTAYPKPEKLFDYELGYTFQSPRFSAGVNLYYMDYTDQLVLNGKLNEIGEAMAENVPDSYRMGMEVTLGARLTDWLRWDVNATWSKNRIKDYVGYLSNYDENWNDLYSQTAIHAGDKPIAFSPSFMLGSLISASWKGFSASLQSQFVTRQYLDNFGTKENSLDPYFVNNLDLSYGFAVRGMKRVEIGVSIYNLFNEKYETNGYSQDAAIYQGGNTGGSYTVSRDPRFYPMAGTNFLAHVALNF